MRVGREHLVGIGSREGGRLAVGQRGHLRAAALLVFGAGSQLASQLAVRRLGHKPAIQHNNTRACGILR